MSVYNLLVRRCPVEQVLQHCQRVHLPLFKPRAFLKPNGRSAARIQRSRTRQAIGNTGSEGDPAAAPAEHRDKTLPAGLPDEQLRPPQHDILNSTAWMMVTTEQMRAEAVWGRCQTSVQWTQSLQQPAAQTAAICVCSVVSIIHVVKFNMIVL